MKNLTKKQKKQLTVGAALLALLLLWRISRASAKTPPKGKVTIGPITVERVTDIDPFQTQREKRAALRHRVLDLIGFDEDAWQPTRRPTTADNIVLDGLLSSIGGFSFTVPDPDGFDAGFDADLKEMVQAARALDPSTSSRPPVAFGSSRYQTRRINIEEEIRDLVAMNERRQLRRRPTDAEMIVIERLLTEYDSLAKKLYDIDPEAELYDEPLRSIVATARSLPASSSAVAPVSTFIPGSSPSV